jgi:hypothetical protein
VDDRFVDGEIVQGGPLAGDDDVDVGRLLRRVGDRQSVFASGGR